MRVELIAIIKKLPYLLVAILLMADEYVGHATPVVQSLCSDKISSITPKPEVKTFKFRNSTGICAIVKMSAYLELYNDEYIELDGGIVSSNSDCSEILVRYDCAYIGFQLVESIISKSGSIKFPSYFLVRTYVKMYPDFEWVRTDSFDGVYSNGSYRCDSERSISKWRNLLEWNTQSSIVLSNIIIEAFRDAEERYLYRPQRHCAQDLGDVFIHRDSSIPNAWPARLEAPFLPHRDRQDFWRQFHKKIEVRNSGSRGRGWANSKGWSAWAISTIILAVIICSV